MSEPQERDGHVPLEDLALWREGWGPEDREAVEAHVRACPGCAEQVRALEREAAGWAELPASLTGLDLVPRLRPHLRRRRPWRTAAGLATATGLLAAGLLLAIRPGPEGETGDRQGLGDDVPVAKGSAGPSDFVGITAYAVAADGSAAPVAGPLGAAQPLVIAYSNAGPRAAEYLMVFAVDARGAVHWYYPAYEPAQLAAGIDPASVPIALGAHQRSLGEQIAHAFAAGDVTLWATFSHRPLHVRAVESWVAAGRWPQGLAGDSLTDAVVQRIDLRAQP